jgi:hypothetical protein
MSRLSNLNRPAPAPEPVLGDTVTDPRIEALRNALPKLRSVDFALSLLRQYDTKGSLSPRQWECVDDMIVKTRAPAQVASLVVDGAAKLFGLFANAARGLEHPRLTFNTPMGTLVVSPAGAQSANAGKLYIKVDGEYAGKMGPDGAFLKSRDLRDAASVGALLTSLCLDPVAAASVYGRRTGVCCFCARRLTDARSVAVGYGPICAEHWGLPWGE